MDNLKIKLNKGDYLNRWELSKTEEVYYDSKPDIMEGEIDNGWLDKGFSIHKYPCRKEFIEEYKNKRISLKQIEKGEIYFPFENSKVEKSGFWYLPTYLNTWAVSNLQIFEDGDYSFALKTCGGVKIWIEDKEVLDFRPYTRNIEQEKKFTMFLKKGSYRIRVFFDDLAERDTLYYFSLKYEGNLPLEQTLNILEDKDKVKSLENFLSGAYFKKDTVLEGNIKLYFSNTLPYDIELQIHTSGDFTNLNEINKRSFQIPAGVQEIDLGNINKYAMGFRFFELIVNLENIKMTRYLTVQLYQKSLLLPSANKSYVNNLKKRKKENLKYIAKYGESIAQRALAMVAEDIDLDKAELILRDQLKFISERKDCSDFYLVPILWLWIKYKNNVFTGKFWEYAENIILNFRYWIDEPGNDVMWYFSENHALLFHVSELLAGQILPDKVFLNSGEKGSVHYKKAVQRLEEWFRRFFVEGFAEWNSTAYLPIDLIGFFAIYELSKERKLRKMAKKAIDMTFKIISMNSHHGVMACSHGRTYQKELKGRYINYTNALVWAAWGIGYLNRATNAQTLFCLSSYEPDQNLKKFVDWKQKGSLIFRNTQGKNGFVNLYLYKNKDYLLTSALDFKPGEKGYQEHVVQGTLGTEALVWVNHPGENIPTGYGRPGYWAGNGYLPRVGQYKNVQLILFNVSKEHVVNYTHAYFPVYAFDEVINKKGWYFAKKDNGYLAINAANGLKLIDKGLNQYRELKSIGRHNSWVIRLGNKDEFNSFKEFVSQITSTKINLEQEEIEFLDPTHGIISFNWREELGVNGEKITFTKTLPTGTVEYLK